MATFRKRGNKWQVRVQRKGYPDLTKTFSERNACAQWARSVESELDRGIFISRSEAESTTFRELLIRYQKEVTPHKKGAKVESYRINAWLKTNLANRLLSTLKSADFADWRETRIKEKASSNTIRLELAVVSHLFNIAKTEWGFESLSNPIEHIRIPKLPNGRTRRVTDEEVELLVKNTESFELPFIINIALETGMRRGEIANLEWRYIDFN
jgi:integrase